MFWRETENRGENIKKVLTKRWEEENMKKGKSERGVSENAEYEEEIFGLGSKREDDRFPRMKRRHTPSTFKGSLFSPLPKRERRREKKKGGGSGGREKEAR